MTEWQPIETAPKDGTRVLLICCKTSAECRRFMHHMEVDFWHDKKTAPKSGFVGWGLFNNSYWPPTHWMPLPEPPK